MGIDTAKMKKVMEEGNGSSTTKEKQGPKQVNALGGFGRYGGSEIERSVVRKPVTRGDKVLERWASIFTSVNLDLEMEECYKKMYGLLEEHKDEISQESINLFCIMLEKLYNDLYDGSEIFRNKAGLFISALVELGNKEEYTIDVSHLVWDIDFLGYHGCNGKQLTVNGNVGDRLGCGNKNWTIKVNGDAGDDVGSYLNGGTIFVDGNAIDVGSNGSHGKITITGNVRHIGITAGWTVKELWQDKIANKRFEDIDIRQLEILEIYIGGDFWDVDPEGNFAFYHRGSFCKDDREKMLSQIFFNLDTIVMD